MKREAARYDETTASHYAGYRPPLHALILERALSNQHFTVGLDIGCGTGYSTLALVDHCDIVMGIDPSPEMLSHAPAQDGVAYKVGDAEHIPLPDTFVDIATYAGSLFYADRQAAAVEVRRVCRGIVLVYDFNVLLDELLANVGDYDHAVDFSGVDGFQELLKRKERLTIDVTAPQLAHLLSRPDESGLTARSVDVDIFYSLYRFV